MSKKLYIPTRLLERSSQLRRLQNFGVKKPGNVMEYLKQLIEDINHILDDGFELNSQIYNIKLMGFIADAPARYEL